MKFVIHMIANTIIFFGRIFGKKKTPRRAQAVKPSEDDIYPLY